MLSLRAPAKLNVGLSIVGRRSDGYHLLESLFWPIAFEDELTLEPAPSIAVASRWDPEAPRGGEPIPDGERNLVHRALRAVEAAGGGTWRAELVKRIPMGAGLGGGSSDAGSVLRHFVGDKPALAEAAVPLGADVPFFLDPRPTWVTGIGEHRVPLAIDPSAAAALRFLVVILPVGLETRAVFDEYRRAGKPFSPSRSLPTLARQLREAGNDLEEAAARQLPLVAATLADLRNASCLHAGMTGSGSTCFAVFDGEEAVKETAQALHPFFRERGCRSFIAKTHAP